MKNVDASHVHYNQKVFVMKDTYHKFSIDVRSQFPDDHFVHDSKVGTVGGHVKVVALYLLWLHRLEHPQMRSRLEFRSQISQKR